MKRLIFFFAFCIPLFGYSQTTPALPFPVSGKWVYHTVTLGSFWKDEFPETQPLLNDSVDSFHFVGLPSVCPGMDTATDAWLGDKWLTQIGNSWYLNSDEYVNWDMQEGDTIYFPFPNMGGDYLVSNIDTIVTTDNIQRRTYHLLVVGSSQPQPYVPVFFGVEFYFIEGIGATVFGLETWYHEDLNILTCFYDESGLEIYHQDYTELGVYDCCNYVGIEEQETIRIRLYPSPASEQINLQFESAHIPQIVQIFNATGQLMHTVNVLGRLQMQLNVSDYAKGIYTVRGRFENGEEVSEKLVVE
jgi:hypothetical protein